MVCAVSDDLQPADAACKVAETSAGTWRRFEYPDGRRFREFKSRHQWLGLPLVHYTKGKCPETGRRVVATGWIAVGRVSFGVVAIGQVAVGALAIGQVALASVFGLGQLSAGLIAVGQFAVALFFGAGQFATGLVAVGQFGFGQYVLAMFGFGAEVWDMRHCTPGARWFFTRLFGL